ncbi:MAG: CRTAC1 family protein [Myxococcota bacterium]
MSKAKILLGMSLLAACHGKDKDGAPLDETVPATAVGRGVVTCLAPGDRAALGPYERRQTEVPRPTEAWIWHGGVVAGDFNGDGLTDLVIALEQGISLYEGLPGGLFTDRGEGPFGGVDLSYASGGSAVDYDADGDLDLYVTRISGFPAPEGGTYGRNVLFRNLGNGQFEDVTDVAGVSGCGQDFRDGQQRCFKSMASSWGDYDGDGDLDLYVGDYGFVDETPGTKQTDLDPAERDFLYRNEGNGTFVDVSDLLPTEFHEGFTYAGGFVDFDGDGRLDLYTVNDFGVLWPNRVLWNDGRGGFVFDPDDPSGLALSMTGMGLGIGDLNGDGLPDLAIAEWKKNTLLESRADAGIWIDSSSSRGFAVDDARNQQVGWGTVLGDVDNDGDLDILQQFGHVVNDNTVVWKNETRQADALYLNDGNGDAFRFTDVAVAWGLADPYMSRGAVLADLNGDGYLDVAKRILDANDAAYLSRCGAEGWARISLHQPGTLNPDAVGALIEVTTAGKTQTRTITAGGVGYASSPPLEAHFGFGLVDTIERIRVVWPDGEESVVEGIATRQRIDITRQ